MPENGVEPYHRVGNWVQAGITGMPFPAEPTELMFRGRILYLIPSRDLGRDNKHGRLYPVVALEHSGMTFEEGQRLISGFLNSVAWVRMKQIDAAVFGGGSRLAGFAGMDAPAGVDDRFALDYLPDPTDLKARLALAFFREGLNLNSVAYQCLSFFKILNLVLETSSQQKAWIDANIADARKLDPLSTRDWERQVGLDPARETPGNYLYVSNRCAIAHAFKKPFVDPYDPDDQNRLRKDLPMVKVLARYMIEQHFGVKSAHAIWQEHLYELQGFKNLFGPELVSRIRDCQEIPAHEFPKLPALSVRQAFRERFSTFENLGAEIIDCAEGRVNLALSSDDKLGSVLLVLNFVTDRLEFEIFHHLATSDDGSLKGAMAELDKLRFQHFYIGNGKLEIWDADERLARKDAFLPENIDLGATHREYQNRISAAEAMYERRLT